MRLLPDPEAALVLEVSGRVSSRGFLASSEPPLASPVLFFTVAFLSHCWCKYLRQRLG